MEPAHYRSTKGQVQQAPEGYWYFIPPPIPRELAYDAETVEILSRADAQLGRLASVGETLPNPQLLIQPYLGKEAVLSSRIEGTQASLTDVFIREAGAEERARANDTEEVINYVRAMRRGIGALEETSLETDLLRSLHGTLLEGVRGRDKDPGRFRSTQNWIGSEGCEVDEATYVPPHPDELPRLLNDFDDFLKRPPKMPVLVQAALLHYHFEAIHPFRDGNGRIGRLMIPLLLFDREALPQPLLYLSEYFETRRDAYYLRLRKVSEDGDYVGWIRFFLEGVAMQAQNALEYTKALLALREQYRARLQDGRATAHSLTVADNLFANPYVTIPAAATRLRVQFPTAQRAIERLVEAGILEEITGQSRNRVYRAREILEALDV